MTVRSIIQAPDERLLQKSEPVFPARTVLGTLIGDLMETRKDVLGEYVPVSEPEPGHTDIFSGNKKWLRGVRWNEIDEHFNVHHVTSKRDKMSEPNIRNAPMVQEELQRDCRHSSVPRTDGQMLRHRRPQARRARKGQTRKGCREAQGAFVESFLNGRRRSRTKRHSTRR